VDSVTIEVMKCVRCRQWVFAVVVLALTCASGWAEEAAAGRPLLHVSFDRLVPKSYPVIRPHFDRIRPTTYPVIRPGVPKVQITNNLTNSFAQPILLTSPIARPFAPAKSWHGAGITATGRP